MKRLLFAFIGLASVAACQKFDDAALWDAINKNSSEIASLKERCSKINSEISNLQDLIVALQINDYITECTPLSDGTGYIILFKSGKSIVIKNGTNGQDGKDGKDGKDGTTPLISVKQGSDGIWYWVINGEWLLDGNGEKVAASAVDGEDGHSGENGKDGITPQLKIENDYWYISTDNGQTWVKLGKATGENGKDGDAFFKGINQDDENVYFELNDGTVIVLPLATAVKFNIILETNVVPVIDPGEAMTIKFAITNATDNTIIKAIAQDGWAVTINKTTKESGEIIVQAPKPIVASEILIFASDGEGHTVMAVLDCVKGQCTIAKNNYIIDCGGGSIDLIVTTNMPYNIVIPEEARSWIFVEAETKSTITEKRTLNIQNNDEYQKRYATIKLADNDGRTLQNIEILQEAAPFSGDLSITTNSAGSLASLLSSYLYASIKSISISGPLNDDDYSFIKDDLLSLRKLNLSGATGVEPNFRNHKYTIDLVILPSCQTSISEYAFSGSYVVQVVMPENLQSIGDGAFYNCSRMTGAIFVPKTVTYIGKEAFYGTECESFSMADGIQLTRFEDLSLPPKIKTLRVPASVITLTGLQKLKELRTLTFEEGSAITEIPSLCFAGLPLENVTLPPSLKRIGGVVDVPTSISSPLGGAFEWCRNLKYIFIPKNVEEIEPGAFYKSGISNVVFEEGSKLNKICGWSARRADVSDLYSTLRIGAFSSTQLESVTIPENVTEIQDAAFAECTKLKSIDFSKSKNLKIIGGMSSSLSGISGAFCFCSSLSGLTIPSSIEEIKAGAFMGCGITSIIFAKNSHLKKISGISVGSGYSASTFGTFSGCTSLVGITIPSSVETIEAGAFVGCTSLSNVNFEDGSLCEKILGISYTEYESDTRQTRIKYCSGAFSGTGIRQLILPSSIKTIGSCSLSKMSYLTSVQIESGANVSFGSRAFYEDKMLAEIDASNAAFSPESDTFWDPYWIVTPSIPDCPIKVVKVGAIRPPECGERAFSYDRMESATLYVPTESVNEYKQAQGWKEFKNVESL